MSGFTRALEASELPPGSRKLIEIEGKPVLLCHAGERIYAITNICSHAEESLETGRMGKTWISCPVHGARFELATGRAMNPPAVRPIKTYETRIEDGWIEVAV